MLLNSAAIVALCATYTVTETGRNHVVLFPNDVHYSLRGGRDNAALTELLLPSVVLFWCADSHRMTPA